MHGVGVTNPVTSQSSHFLSYFVSAWSYGMPSTSSLQGSTRYSDSFQYGVHAHTLLLFLSA